MRANGYGHDYDDDPRNGKTHHGHVRSNNKDGNHNVVVVVTISTMIKPRVAAHMEKKTDVRHEQDKYRAKHARKMQSKKEKKRQEQYVKWKVRELKITSQSSLVWINEI